MIINADLLKELVPVILPAHIETYLPYLQQYMPKFGIDTPQRIGGFIAQLAEESINFSAVREQGSGREYEGRKDLGNTQPGDGERFKGRGLIQITGRGNYAWCSQEIFLDNRLVTNPAILEQAPAAVESACWFWDKAKPLNKVCDHLEDWSILWPHDAPPEKQHTYSKIQWLTLLVNGGQNGIATRTANYQRARKVLNF